MLGSHCRKETWSKGWGGICSSQDQGSRVASFCLLLDLLSTAVWEFLVGYFKTGFVTMLTFVGHRWLYILCGRSSISPQTLQGIRGRAPCNNFEVGRCWNPPLVTMILSTKSFSLLLICWKFRNTFSGNYHMPSLSPTPDSATKRRPSLQAMSRWLQTFLCCH